MLYKDISKILGYYLFGLTASLFIPFIVAGYFQFIADPETHPQPHTTLYFFESIIICFALALFFYWKGKGSSGNLFRKEGLAVVVIIWLLSPLLGSLPFTLSGTLTNPLQAYFELASGLTTTGMTVMEPKKYDAAGQEIAYHKEVCGLMPVDYTYYGTITPVRNPHTGEVMFEGIEAVSKALLFWRSFAQWLGGVGIIVLFIAILPALGVGGKVLFQAEVTGPLKDSLTPRIKESAMRMWKIYLGLTMLQIFLLLLTNGQMPWFDAITISFSTVSTGGLSIHNTNIGHYQNYHTDWVIILFMIFGSINFTLYYYILRGKFYRIYEPEFILFVCTIIVACALGSWFLIGGEKVLLNGTHEGTFSPMDAIHYGIFEVVAAITSAGFAIADTDHWPPIVQTLLLILTFIGGMSGSTAGGIKIIRHYMLFRIVQSKLESLYQPEKVAKIKLADREIDIGAANMVLCFFWIVISISVVATFVYIMEGIDPQTALGLVAATVNNGGVGFVMAGPTSSCAFLSNFGLIFSAVLMILGRLEFFAVLAVFVPSFWKKNS